MRIRFVLALVAVAVVAFVGAAAVTRYVSSQQSSDSVPARQAARTSLPGLTAATGDPTLSSLRSLRPAPHTVAQAAGPFDDRLQLRGLSFDGKQVRGSARVISDVSELLALEVLAGFYDSRGRLLGTARYIHDPAKASPDDHNGTSPAETERFTITVPEQLRGTAVSAAVGVPVLVNE